MKFIVHHPDGSDVLLQGGEFPTLDLTEGQSPVQVVQETWSLKTWLLHDEGWQFGLPNASQVRLQALNADLPAGFQWGSAEVPPLLGARPWQQPGWPTRAAALLDTELQSQGIQRLGELQPVGENDLSCIQRAETTAGRVYLKVSETGREAAVTAAISEMWPDLTPEIISAKSEAGLLITKSAGALLDSSSDLTAWTQAVERLAQFQQQANASRLSALGCPAYPLTAMTERVDALLADTSTLEGWGLEADRLQTLQSARPDIRAAFQALAALNLPLMTAHGDAHPRNVLHGERGSVWFDFSEVAAPAHPFMDMGWFLTFTFHPSREQLPIRQQHPDLLDHLCHAYLTALGYPDTTTQLLKAMPLAMLHRAALYDTHYRHWQGTIPGWRPNFVPYYLRNALRELRRL